MLGKAVHHTANVPLPSRILRRALCLKRSPLLKAPRILLYKSYGIAEGVPRGALCIRQEGSGQGAQLMEAESKAARRQARRVRVFCPHPQSVLRMFSVKNTCPLVRAFRTTPIDGG